MERDHFGRPVCLGQGITRPCRSPVHPGYWRCPWCDRAYDTEQMREALKNTTPIGGFVGGLITTPDNEGGHRG